MSYQKTKNISIRMSADDYEVIKSRADKAEQNVSRFITEAATSGEGLTLSQKQSIYYHLSRIRDLARNECGETEK